MAKADTTQQRLSALELLLLWEGILNRSRLANILGVGDIRASQLIQAFRTAYPRWLTWNNKSRSYHVTHEAYAATKRDGKVRDRAESLVKYLNLVGLPYVASDAEATNPICSAFPDLSTPEPQVFAILSQAIRSNSAVEISYRSMAEPAPHRRIISPHHLVRAGRRWHVRAFCVESNAFRDYTLRRIVEVKPQQQGAKRGAMDDEAWMTMVPVRLIAHPLLSFEQQEVIRFEYFSNTSACVHTCRAALVPYFIQDMRAALDPETQRPPDYQLAVQNLAEVKPWVFPS